jgi:NAD(P)-dependent dehydrogenase (short-subunit alcohol dehydrogenase family)
MGRNREDRVAIVTGAGSGIGRATALRLATDGYGVTLAGRRVDRLKETADLTRDPGRTLVSNCDVTDTEAVTAMIAATQERFGRIDALINNAGISRTAAFSTVTLAGARSWASTSSRSYWCPASIRGGQWPAARCRCEGWLRSSARRRGAERRPARGVRSDRAPALLPEHDPRPPFGWPVP